MSQGTTPPGWYDDGQGAQRWWDGTSGPSTPSRRPASAPVGPGGA